VKLVTFVVNGVEKIGSLKRDRVVDLKEARTIQLLSLRHSIDDSIDRVCHEIPGGMIEFIEGGAETLAVANEAEEFALKNKGFNKIIYSLNEIKLKAPIPNPKMNFHMGNAYRPFEIRSFGMKPATGVIGPDDPIVIPKEITDFGSVYECEVGIIIGKKGRRIPNNETAYDYVYGYTIYNDVTDYGKQIQEIFGSKIHDTFCPLGPCIATKDEIKDPHKMDIRAWVNGQKATDRNTREMLHKIPEFVSIPSKTLTLLPGAVISTGAPDAGRIKPGDILELEISEIGKIRNPVIAEK
jgi:acylpyruvate hydrolase